MEKVYKTMGLSGGAAITVGIVMTVVGVTAGIVSIMIGAQLLKKKSGITF